MRIAVLFDNFGPYHLARLTAASELCDLLAIEFAAASGDYAWQRDSSSRTFRSYTIYRDGASDQCSTSTLRRELCGALEEFRPEVVAIPGWSGRLAFAAMAWCIDRQVPVVLMSESTAEDETRVGWKEFVKRQYVAACEAALVGGERHREYLTILGMPAERIYFGYNAVDNDYFRRQSEVVRRSESEHRQLLRLPERYFLSSARFIEKKNLPNLLDAYAQYRRVYERPGFLASPWDLIILGEGYLRHELETRRDQLGLHGSVHMPGFKQYDDLPAYYALAEAFIHVSASEPWGLVVNEAMSSGLPVLVSKRCGCATMLLNEGDNGFTCDPADTASIATCMMRMTELPESKRAAMAQASASIIAEFGPRRFAEGLQQAASAAVERRVRRRLTAAALSCLLLVTAGFSPTL